MLKKIKYYFKKEIPILMYHRIIDSEQEIGKNSIYLNVEEFVKQLQYLKNNNFRTITFKELSTLNKEDRKKNKYVILTFDDGYKDNYDLVFPLLKKYNMKAVIYMVSHEKYNKWDIENGEKKFELMSLEQMLEMHKSNLVEFGGHTLHHVKLNTLTEEEQRYEILENKKYLENILGEKLYSFAYPYGIFNQISKKVVKDIGYDYVVATDSGPFLIEEDLQEIRRIGIFPDITMSKFRRRVKGNYNLKYVK